MGKLYSERKSSQTRSGSKNPRSFGKKHSLIKSLPKLFQVQPSSRGRLKMRLKSNFESVEKSNLLLLKDSSTIVAKKSNRSFVENDFQDQSFNDFQDQPSHVS